MKKIKYYIIIIILFFPFLVDGDTLITLPTIETIQSNDVSVFYAQDTLPQCTVYISIGAGSLYEDASNAGISQMAALVLSMGGSVNYPNINEYVDAIGGRYSVSASFETITITMRVHADEAQNAFAILADVIAQPLVNDNLVETARSLCKQQIKQKQDNPMDIAIEKARQAVFGDSGYGAVMSVRSLDACTVDSLKQFLTQHIVKNNVRIGIVTSLEKESILRDINTLTNTIPPGSSTDYTADITSAINNVKNSRVVFIQKDIPQSTIILATVAPSLKSNFRYELEVANYIFGGGSFNSWLMNEIRVKRGYAYATGSILRMRKNIGLFLAYAQTSDSTTAKTIEIMENIFAQYGINGPSDDEIQWAKEALVNSYIFDFKSLRDIVQYYMWLDYNNLPVSYIHAYTEKIQNVSKASIVQSWNSLRTGYVIVVVGNKNVKEQLRVLKKDVTVVQE